MPKLCPRLRADENRAFLLELAQTGNARDAARRLGLSRTRFTKRRAADPDFAARWEAALAMADAALSSSPERGGVPRPQGVVEGRPRRAPTSTTTRTRTGLQLRPTPATAITPEAEQRFLRALSATANVRLAARAAGYAHSSFYARKRTNPAFAREWRMALALGWEQLQCALLHDHDPAAYAHDHWRCNDPPPVPPMTANQALQLLYLHQKEARLGGESLRVKRRRGEPDDVWWQRVRDLREADLERERETFRVAEAERQALGRGSPYFTAEGLPDLSQVGGWSKADADKPAHHPQRALFGGWRVEDMEE